MKMKCPCCGAEINEYKLGKHKQNCLRKVQPVKVGDGKFQNNNIVKPNSICPYCKTTLKRKFKECPYCYKKLPKHISSKGTKRNYTGPITKTGTKSPKPATTFVHKPIETAAIKIPKIEKI